MPDSFIYKQLQLVSLFGNNFIFALVVLFLLATYFFYRNYRIEAGFILLTILSFPYSVLLKGLFKQSRPLTATLSNTFLWNNYSFPSTHVVFYTVFFGYLIYLSFKLKRLSQLNVHFIRLISIYFLVLVGVSRVYLGMHWMSDVLAGYVFGSLFLTVLIYLEKSVTKYKNKNN